MDLDVAFAKMDFLVNHMNGMVLICLVNSAKMGHAHVKKIMMAHIVIIVYKASMDFTVQMVLIYTFWLQIYL